ncbi:phage protein [Streptococcus pneumoniae]|nr:phage protein [Streptococcus pneumoniae]
MNKTTEMIVFRSRKTGEFLNSYKNRSSLAFAAGFCSLEYCLKLPRKKYEDNKKTYKALAAAFDCEIVAVEAEYNQ